MEPSAAATGIPALPCEVITAVLCHLPAKERCSCALVCKTWQAACISAHSSIAVRLHNQAQADNLCAWLGGQHGASVQQLDISTDLEALEQSVLQWDAMHKQCLERALAEEQRVAGAAMAQWQQQLGRGGPLFPPPMPPPLVGVPDLADRPTTPCIKLPWQQLQGLQRLRLQYVHIKPQQEKPPPRHPPVQHNSQQQQQIPTAAQEALEQQMLEEQMRELIERQRLERLQRKQVVLPHLTHLHIDEALYELVEVLQLPDSHLHDSDTDAEDDDGASDDGDEDAASPPPASAPVSSERAAAAAAVAAAVVADPQASALPSLTALSVTSTTSKEYPCPPVLYAYNYAFRALCAQAPRLQQLLISTTYVTPENGMKALASLPALQRVELHAPTDGGFSRRPVFLGRLLQPLPLAQLTCLVLKRLHNDSKACLLDLSPASIGQLSACTALQHLEIAHGSGFAPCTLAPLSSLTHLQLRAVQLGAVYLKQPATTTASAAAAAAGGGQTGSNRAADGGGSGSRVSATGAGENTAQAGLVGAAAMLAVLPCLQQLRVLQLSPELLPAPLAPLQQYSALTASSHLTLLSLYDCQLPAGAAAATFPPGRLLPDLTSLRLPQPLSATAQIDIGVGGSIGSSNGYGRAVAAGGGGGDDGAITSSTSSRSASLVIHPGPPFCGAGSINSLVSACPHLRQLWLTAAVAAGVDLNPLRALSGLTELQLGGCVVDDGVAESVLCELVQLQRLDLVQSPGFTDAGLAYLTALTALTSLQVRECGLSHCTAALGHTLYMCKRHEDNTGRSAATPPVCERLRQQCTNSRECLLVMLKQRDAQLAAATAALAAAQANRGTEGGN